MNTATMRQGRGRQLAERLGLQIVRQDGRDLRVACVRGCGSSDNGHIDIDSGVYGCWSCNRGLSAIGLAQLVTGDRDRAMQVLRDVGLFDHQSHYANGSDRTMPAGDIIAIVAERKGTTAEAFIAYGAHASGSRVVFPTYRIDADKVEQCSTFSIDAGDPTDKGKHAYKKPAGFFLPNSCGPTAGETWILTEGAKNGPAYHSLGFKAVGLNGHFVRKDFLPGFARSFAGAHAILAPDGDVESIDSFLAIGQELLRAGAASVKLACLP